MTEASLRQSQNLRFLLGATHFFFSDNSRYLGIPFLDACLATRLPDKGSNDQPLEPMDTNKAALLLGGEAKPMAGFNGNPDEAVWLPNEAVAKAWVEYVKPGATGGTTPPSAPFDVRVLSNGGRGDRNRLERRGRFRERHHQFQGDAGWAGTGEGAEEAIFLLPIP